MELENLAISVFCYTFAPAKRQCAPGKPVGTWKNNLETKMKLYSDEELAGILDQDIFHLISEAADHLGVECYVVGGYVRDIFLERPSNDIDVVVVGSGIEVAQELKRRLGRRAHLSVLRTSGRHR